jgi:hypothetical protein
MKTLPDGTPTQLWLDPTEDPIFGTPNFADRDIRCVQLPASQVHSVMRRLLDSAPQTGWWPVLAGGPDQSTYVRHFCFLEVEPPPPVSEQLSAAAKIDVPDWFRQRERNWKETCQQDAQLQQDFDNLKRTANGWPDHAPVGTDRLTEEGFIPYWTQGDAAVILLIPCRDPWQILGVLNFGGANNRPHPVEQVAVWRQWYEKWGATVFAIGEPAVCGLASRRPTERDAALQLAWQHFFYDNEAMRLDGAFLSETIPQLAQHRMTHPIWIFWWD